MEKQPLIIIAGPTACGKTSISVKLAQKINGEIISGDSMQVYRFMDIGTAKITKEEMEGVKHHLIDVLNPDEEFNVKLFQEMAKNAVGQIAKNRHMPILVGGTGFYIRALVNDNHFMETIENSSYRQMLSQEAEQYGSEFLYEKLKQVDSESAKLIHPHNKKRVIRALEFYHFTGIPMAVHNRQEQQRESPYHTYFFILTMDREKLYQRINQRVDSMLADGFVEEVKILLEKGYHKNLVSMQGIGYREIVSYLEGGCSLDTAIENIKKNTRHFAKRQFTWFKRQAEGVWIDVTELTAEDAAEELRKQICKIDTVE